MVGKPGLGQGVLPDMPEIEANPIIQSLDIQKNFKSLIQPQVWGLDVNNYLGLSGQELEMVSPTVMRDSLIDVQPRSRGAVSFREAITNKPLWIALNPIEYGHVSRSVSALGSSAVNKTLVARSGAGYDPKHDEIAERSGVHQVERKMDKMTVYVRESLEPETARISRFEEYARHSWMRRGKGINGYAEMAWIQQQIFDNMLAVVGRQRGWDQEQTELAKRALEYRLFFAGDGNQRVHNWQGALALAKEYNLAKTALYKDRIHQSKRYIREHAE